MILDFALRKEISTSTIHEKFDESLRLLSKYYKMNLNNEYTKLLLIMKVHEYFLSREVKQGAKPAITVRDVSRVE